MAYEIVGTVFKINATEDIPTRNGGTLLRRSVILCQRRFDQNTGQEYEPNYPIIDFTNNGCAELDRFNPGDRVRIRFDVSGVKYVDKKTGEEKFFSSLRGFRIEPYVTQQTHYQSPPQYAQQPQQTQQARSQQGYASQIGYQQGHEQQAEQPLPFPPPDNSNLPY